MIGSSPSNFLDDLESVILFILGLLSFEPKEMTTLLSTTEFSPKLARNNICSGLNIRARPHLFPGKFTLFLSLLHFLIHRVNDFEEVLVFVGFIGGGIEQNNRIPLISLAVTKLTAQTSTEIQGKGRKNNQILSEGRDEDEKKGGICPGCGVFMQHQDPNLPGYYQERNVSMTQPREEDDFYELVDDDIMYEQGNNDGEGTSDEFDWDSDEWEDKLMNEENDLELDGFAPADVGYGNITEETVKRAEKKGISKSEKKRRAREAHREREREEVTVCARCHSLRNYGQVKNQAAENLIPDFDFDRLIANRLMKPTSNSNNIVVIVVDCVDFDGSFPKRAAKSLFKALEGNKNDLKVSKRLPKLVLVATKVDLLPSQISPTRLDRWVRHRAKAAGAPKLTGVYLVSARKDIGVRNLLSFIKELAGPRGNVWVIGAQNAGKSTLINALAKKEGAKVTKLTEAPIPGTTLGILRIAGILSAKAKLFDTPGLLHPYLVSMRLNREEQKMVEIRKELQPRSYRVKVSCISMFYPISIQLGIFISIMG